MYTNTIVSIILIICLILYMFSLKKDMENFSSKDKLTDKELVRFAKSQIENPNHLLKIKNKKKPVDVDIETQILNNSQLINKKIYSQNITLTNINNQLDELIEKSNILGKEENIMINSIKNNQQRCV